MYHNAHQRHFRGQISSRAMTLRTTSCLGCRIIAIFVQRPPGYDLLYVLRPQGWARPAYNEAICVTVASVKAAIKLYS